MFGHVVQSCDRYLSLSRSRGIQKLADVLRALLIIFNERICKKRQRSLVLLHDKQRAFDRTVLIIANGGLLEFNDVEFKKMRQGFDVA